MFARRASWKMMAALFRRLSTSLEAGVDLRKTWQHEVRRAPAWLAERFAECGRALEQGESLHAAWAPLGPVFPDLVHEMVAAGEASGKLPNIFRRLADHYDFQIRLRQSFLRRITWPAIQLLAAVAIIGLLIWILGVIGTGAGGEPAFDPLGWGLYGTRGLIIYLLGVSCVAAAFGVVYLMLRRGALSLRPLQYALWRLPVLGDTLTTLALSRLAWCLHLTLDSEMDVRRAIGLGLRATKFAPLADTEPGIKAALTQNKSIYEALMEAGRFPPSFMDTIHVGEQSGRLPESLAILSRQYQERAETAMETLSTVAAFLVWAGVALLIIIMIFRLFSSYIGILNSVM